MIPKQVLRWIGTIFNRYASQDTYIQKIYYDKYLKEFRNGNPLRMKRSSPIYLYVRCQCPLRVVYATGYALWNNGDGSYFCIERINPLTYTDRKKRGSIHQSLLPSP